MAGAAIGIVTAVVGAVVSHDAAQDAQKAKKQQAMMAQMEASYNARLQKRETDKLVSRQRAAYAASGVALDDTPYEVMALTAAEADEERQMMLRLGGMKSDSLMTEGDYAYKLGQGEMWGSLLTGAGYVAKGISNYSGSLKSSTGN
jgi:hypothetical protein